MWTPAARAKLAREHLPYGIAPVSWTAAATLQPSEAAEVLRQEQREIAEDWTAAARRYLAR